MNTTWALPQVDETRCTLCGLCVEACPCHAVELGERGPVFTCPEACLHQFICAEAFGCNCLCEEVCPTGAITCAFEIVLEADQSKEDMSTESHKSKAALLRHRPRAASRSVESNRRRRRGRRMEDGQ